jgi:hypothetical protein
VLRRIFGPLTGGNSKEIQEIHNEKLYIFYYTPNVVRVIRSRKIKERVIWYKWNKGEMHTKYWSENMKERDDLENRDKDGRLI